MEGTTSGGARLAFRAVLAVALTVAFYAFAIGLAISLLVAARGLVTETRDIPIHLVVACVVGAGSILWGVFPRWDRFVAPGPRLDAEGQPRLYRVLESVAEATRQGMPEDVYLAPDVNAGVLQRGGILGFGGRRVMVLGLPVLTVLPIPEFRAVLAHEFGHFLGGETKIGSWIFRTRAAIGRIIGSLSQAGSLLRFLFIWYGHAFLRITLAISRCQELEADRLAGEVEGPAALAAGLRRVHGAGAAYGAFFGTELVPALAAGFRPPLAEGFSRFLGARPVAEQVETVVEELVEKGEEDPYDSHPPLRVRLEALGNPAPPVPGSGGPVAATLLDGLDDLEAELLATVFPGKAPPPAMPWREAGVRVHLPMFRKTLAENRDLLRGLTPATLPAALARPAGDPRWSRRGAPHPGAAEAPARRLATAAMSMTLHLAARGWSVRSEPGREISLQRVDEAFFPFQELEDVASGLTSASGWIERCRLLGIDSVPLDAPPPPRADSA